MQYKHSTPQITFCTSGFVKLLGFSLMQIIIQNIFNFREKKLPLKHCSYQQPEIINVIGQYCCFFCSNMRLHTCKISFSLLYPGKTSQNVNCVGANNFETSVLRGGKKNTFHMCTISYLVKKQQKFKHNNSFWLQVRAIYF